MIPKVRAWKVRTEDNLFSATILTINKAMVRIICRMDYPSTWGKRLIISVAKGVQNGRQIQS